MSPEVLDEVLFSLAGRVSPIMDLLKLSCPLPIVFDEFVVNACEYMLSSVIKTESSGKGEKKKKGLGLSSHARYEMVNPLNKNINVLSDFIII